jgi:hypothetical protein
MNLRGLFDELLKRIADATASMAAAFHTQPVSAVPVIALVVSSFALIVSCVAAYLNREKLRLDLYARRFGVYSQALDFCQCVTDWDDADAEKLKASQADLKPVHKAFVKALRESKFLFHPKSGIYELLVKINAQSFSVTNSHKIPVAQLSREEVFARHAENTRLDKWFREEALSELDAKTAPYLNFHKWGVVFSGWKREIKP